MTFDSKHDTDKNITLVNTENSVKIIIKQIGPHEAYQTMGVLINTNGTYEAQVEKIVMQIKICTQEV